MNIKAAGVITSMVLALAPTLIDWLGSTTANGVLSPTGVAVAVIVINAVVKFLQVAPTATPEMSSRSLGAASQSAWRSWLLG